MTNERYEQGMSQLSAEFDAIIAESVMELLGHRKPDPDRSKTRLIRLMALLEAGRLFGLPFPSRAST